MEHPLHTITYVADIDNTLVIMAHRQQPQAKAEAGQATSRAEPKDVDEGGTKNEGEAMDEGEATEEVQPIQRMMCHVLESDNVSGHSR